VNCVRWALAPGNRFYSASLIAFAVILLVALAVSRASTKLDGLRGDPTPAPVSAAPEPSPQPASPPADPAATENAAEQHDDEGEIDTRPAETAAVGFVSLWLADTNIDPYVTEELGAALADVDPSKMLQEAIITGPPKVGDVSAHSIQVTVPTSEVEIAVTVDYNGERWLVAGLEQA